MQDQLEQETSQDVKEGGRESARESGNSTRIGRKFSWTVCLLILLTMCVFWLISNYHAQNLLRQQADNLGQSLAQLTASQMTELVLANDLISMNVVLGSLVENAAIEEVAVLNINNQLMAAAESGTLQAEPLVPLPFTLSRVEGEYSAAIELADSVAGYVRVRLDLSYIEVGLINNFLLIVAATLLLLIVSGSLITLYFQYLVSFPGKLLAYGLSNIRQGKVETIPESRSNNELSQAIRQFNATAEFLAQNTFLDSFTRSQQDSGLDQVPDTSNESMTLLCIRLVNFHYLSSTLDSNTLLDLLNRYYFYSGKVAQLYNGSVAYCADGEVIVSFSSERLEEEQAFYAICAGQLFLQLGDILSQNPAGGHAIDAKFSLAVHSDEGIKSWSPVTGDYDNISGKVLDQVRQICSECPDNALLISEPTFQQAGAGTRVDAERFGMLQPEGSIQVYLAREPMADYRMLLQKQAQQLDSLYRVDTP